MGTASVLSLAQDAAAEISLGIPGGLIDVTNDRTALKLKRLLHKVCGDLQSRHDWENLKREHTFTTTAADVQTGGLPTDFLRMVPDTIYNRTSNWRVMGPITANDWQSYKATLTNRVFDAYRIRGGDLLIAPLNPGSETIAFEYITNYIGKQSDDTEVATFQDDTDTTYFDDELVRLGMVWMHRKAEGIDYAEEFRAYELRITNLAKGDGGPRIVDMCGATDDFTPRAPRVPDTLVGL
jgi:hypothetical protein